MAVLQLNFWIDGGCHSATTPANCIGNGPQHCQYIDVSIILKIAQFIYVELLNLLNRRVSAKTLDVENIKTTLTHWLTGVWEA